VIPRRPKRETGSLRPKRDAEDELFRPRAAFAQHAFREAMNGELASEVLDA
jgi:hypothetical protein